MDNNVQELSAMLMKSNWPKSEEIAQKVYIIGTTEAKEALLGGLSGKRHAIRTACIKYIAEFNDTDTVEIIKKFLNDSSYETRMEAKAAIKKLTGNDVLTSRGE